MFFLKQDTTRKGRVNQELPKPKKEFDFSNNNKEYEVKAIIDSAVYNKKANNKMPGLYYLVL